MGLFDASSGGLVTYWKTKTGITDLVGTATNARMWPDAAKQGADAPYIVFVRGGGNVNQRLAASADSGGTTILHVYCVGATAAQAATLAEAVSDNTVDYRGSMSGTRIMYVKLVDSPDSGFETPWDGTDQKRFWTRVVLRIAHD